MAGIRNPSRDMVECLATALSPEETDERTATAFLNAGLRAIGFAGEIERHPFLDEIIEAGVIEVLPR